jgi:hypothetical protein
VCPQVKSSKDYVGFFDFLALQNQCFDKPDGQYTYSVCIGKDVRQKDTGGGSSTLLGASCLSIYLSVCLSVCVCLFISYLRLIRWALHRSNV